MLSASITNTISGIFKQTNYTKSQLQIN